MTNEHRYILEKGNKKYFCPDCNKKRFVRYIDTVTGDYLPEDYGRCDREIKCTYFLNPYTDGYAKMITDQERGANLGSWKPKPIKRTTKSPQSTVYIPNDVFNKTLNWYEQNVFIQNLLSRVSFPFDAKDVERVISQYYLGTICNGYRAGAITFPFIDKTGNVRAIQVKQFGQTNHTTGTDFLHSIIEKYHLKKNEALPGWLGAYHKNETKVSCLFGSHLLSKYPLNPVGLVEAPKTAIYGTLYFGFPEQPENLLWLAVYNLSSLSLEKCKALHGRDVYLFPDLSKDGTAFAKWSNQAKQFTELIPGTRFEVSDYLETLAPNELKEHGADIADVLIKMDWRKFRPKPSEQIQIIKPPDENVKSENLKVENSLQLKSGKGENSEALKQTLFLHDEILPTPKSDNSLQLKIQKPGNWDEDIKELEHYFKTTTLPTQPVKLNQCSTITNFSLFIESHFATVKANNGKRTFLPYLNRLKDLKMILTPTLKEANCHH